MALSLFYVQNVVAYGFVPLLALAGFKDVKHLNKVKIYEHILLITQLVDVLEIRGFNYFVTTFMVVFGYQIIKLLHL